MLLSDKFRNPLSLPPPGRKPPVSFTRSTALASQQLTVLLAHLLVTCVPCSRRRVIPKVSIGIHRSLPRTLPGICTVAKIKPAPLSDLDSDLRVPPASSLPAFLPRRLTLCSVCSEGSPRRCV